ncbi:MAG: 4'-phosphopantetheinyl transferase family protein [Candidatus Comchoanobacterales bacterium]
MNDVTLWYQNINASSHCDWRQKVQHFKLEVLQHQIQRDDSIILKTSLGKPYLDPSYNTDQWHFSLSHSRNMVAMAWARNKEIGLDIEHLDRNISTAVINRMFHPDEIHWLKQHNNLPQALQFWTAKEALAKATGLGGYRSFKQLPLSVPLSSNKLIAPKPWKLHYLEQNKHAIHIAHSFLSININLNILT